MKLLKQLFGVIIFIVFSQSAHAALNIFACEPEWGALAVELGGKNITLYTATTAQQNVHHIQARPSLIAKIRQANLVVCTGAELEIGWLPVLLQRGANPRVRPGSAGYFEAASVVNLLGRPKRLDRAEGDIHASGNPHIQMDPRNILLVARALSERLAALDPANKADYQARFSAFDQRWSAAIARWQLAAAPLKNMPIVVHHDSWLYLTQWLGLNVVASLEPKPGIPPSAGDLSALLQKLQKQPVKIIIHAAYENARPDQWLAQRANIPAVTLPFTVGGTPGANDLYGLFDDTIARLLTGLKAS